MEMEDFETNNWCLPQPLSHTADEARDFCMLGKQSTTEISLALDTTVIFVVVVFFSYIQQ